MRTLIWVHCWCPEVSLSHLFPSRRGAEETLSNVCPRRCFRSSLIPGCQTCPHGSVGSADAAAGVWEPTPSNNTARRGKSFYCCFDQPYLTLEPDKPRLCKRSVLLSVWAVLPSRPSKHILGSLLSRFIVSRLLFINTVIFYTRAFAFFMSFPFFLFFCLPFLLPPLLLPSPRCSFFSPSATLSHLCNWAVSRGHWSVWLLFPVSAL